MQDSVLVGIDGNVYCGKTALATALCSHQGTYVPEYSAFVCDADLHDLGALQRQDAYLKADKERSASFRPGPNILDRSIVSLSAHVYAIHTLGEADIRADFSELCRHVQPRVPLFFIHVSTPYVVAMQRYNAQESSTQRKGTASYLCTREYFGAIEEFNRRIGLVLPQLTIDGNAPWPPLPTILPQEMPYAEETQVLEKILSCLTQ